MPPGFGNNYSETISALITSSLRLPKSVQRRASSTSRGYDCSASGFLETVIVLIHLPLHLYKPTPGNFFLIVFFLQPLATTSNLIFLPLAMASSSSSTSSAISFESESSLEPTLEYDPIATYEILAPLHWDAGEWDFQSWSEDDKSLTDGEDLLLLLGDELEEDDEDGPSWEEELSTSEEKADSSSTEEDSVIGNFLLGGSSEDAAEDDEETEDDGSFTSSSCGDDDSNGNSNSDDSDISTAPPTKRRKISGVYWW
jgi:hypothetical protein